MKKRSPVFKVILLLLTGMVLVWRVSACTQQPQSPPAQSSPLASAPAGVSALISQFACVPTSAEYQAAELEEIIDGDTIEVRIGKGAYRVRYIGIDAPERDEGQGPAATQFNTGLVEGQTLYLLKDVSDTDAYGRLLRYVFTDDAFVNYELLLNGYARQGSYAPDTACDETFTAAQQSARQNSAGIWASPQEAGQAAVQITALQYRGPGGENEPGEYVEIQNTGAQTVDLTGWYLKDQGKNRFEFPSLQMEAGQTCRIYTNEDHPESCGLSFSSTSAGVWNNNGDCAALHDADGLVIDEYCYP
jgi:micrococcal nuclease